VAPGDFDRPDLQRFLINPEMDLAPRHAPDPGVSTGWDVAMDGYFKRLFRGLRCSGRGGRGSWSAVAERGGTGADRCREPLAWREGRRYRAPERRDAPAGLRLAPEAGRGQAGGPGLGDERAAVRRAGRRASAAGAYDADAQAVQPIELVVDGVTIRVGVYVDADRLLAVIRAVQAASR
jgi:hypothetical protein